MRPPILTDSALAEIDASSDLDAIDRAPTDEAMTRDVYREMWPHFRWRKGAVEQVEEMRRTFPDSWWRPR